MSLKRVLLAATVLALPVAAQAQPVALQSQPVNGLYIAGGIGANWRLDSSDRGLKVKTDTGWVGLGSIGWGFGNGLRAEVEGNFRNNDVSKMTLNGTRIAGSQGYVQTYGAMVNVLYDFNGLFNGPVVPYVGAGVGYGWNEWRHTNVRSGNTTLSLSDSEGAFAYQGILGVSYGLGDMVPGLALTAEARYYGTLAPSMDGSIRTGNGPVRPFTFKPDNNNISALIGVRYNFGVTPPPVVAPAPAPAPAPQVARTYLVFFDWDRADLTARAREIIREAATNSQRANVTRIEVAGHADRSGSAAYNQRLSQRRAEAVAAELVRDGVARSAITVQAFGESRPLVPTADGVREPQNRRVEIVLR
jgi:OmpA-OmpF porin, OOP family